MSETSAKTGGTAPPSKDDSYGPDRTLVQVADWLTEKVDLFRSIFVGVPTLRGVFLEQRMDSVSDDPFARHGSRVESKYELDDDRVILARHLTANSPVEADGFHELFAKVASEVQMLEEAIKMGARPVDPTHPRAFGMEGDTISRICVLSREPFFFEDCNLNITRDLRCTGLIQTHEFSPENPQDSPFEQLQQCFSWAWDGHRFRGVQIELRLWSRYICSFLLGQEKHKIALGENPALIYEHDETVHFRHEGFRSLFLMRRPPNRIEFAKNYISVVYLGENVSVRGGGGSVNEINSRTKSMTVSPKDFRSEAN